MTRTLFVGCGDGTEVEIYHQSHKEELFGIEPAESEYDRAVQRCKDYENIHIFHTTLQNYAGHKSASERFHKIIFVFPSPFFLCTQMGSVEMALQGLLHKDGQIRIYTEIDFQTCDQVDLNGILLHFFMDCLERKGWKNRCIQQDYEEAEDFVKQSGCGLRLSVSESRKLTCIDITKCEVDANQ